MQEIWKDVDGFDNLYQVSNTGRVRRKLSDGYYYHKLTPTKSGYVHVVMSSRGKKNQKTMALHRLVAFAFCHKPVGCDVVNHIDNNPSNNNSDNLEWTTYKGNTQHAIKQGRWRAGKKMKHAIVAHNGKKKKIYKATGEIVKDGFDLSCVYRCLKGKQKHHKGYKWSYQQEENHE